MQSLDFHLDYRSKNNTCTDRNTIGMTSITFSGDESDAHRALKAQRQRVRALTISFPSNKIVNVMGSSNNIEETS